jgi:hypothetical protein
VDFERFSEKCEARWTEWNEIATRRRLLPLSLASAYFKELPSLH